MRVLPSDDAAGHDLADAVASPPRAEVVVEQPRRLVAHKQVRVRVMRGEGRGGGERAVRSSLSKPPRPKTWEDYNKRAKGHRSSGRVQKVTVAQETTDGRSR